MKTTKFTAKIVSPTGTRCISNCTIYKGKVVQVYKRGIGEPHTVGGLFNGEGDVWDEYDQYIDAYKPYFNATLLEENGLTRETAQKIMEEKGFDYTFKDQRFLNCMFVMGENPNGYFVSDADEEKRIKEATETEKNFSDIREKKVAIPFYNDILGYTTNRLPKEIWDIIRPFGEYHTGDEGDQEWADDMGYIGKKEYELKGWYYKKGAIQALLNEGYRVSYREIEIHSENETAKVDEDIRIENERAAKAFEKFGNERQALISEFFSLYNNGETMTNEETEKLLHYPEIHFYNINISGADIWGGGKWMHEDEKYLYLVVNNGHDGDNWSFNNYRTGGAGAIAVKVEKTDKVIDFLKRARDFENKTYKDYLSIK